jgi:hypothetical protein
MRTAKYLSWLLAAVGLWEVLAPYFLGYSVATIPTWNAYIAGAVLIVLAVWAAFSEQVRLDRNLEWINAVVGVWLILAPFILGYSAIVAALWNDIIVGVVVIVLATWAATAFGRPAPQA